MWATILCLALSAPAVSQVIIGGAKPEVEVDRSVLDRLGAEPTLPDLLLGRRPAAQSVAATQPPVKQGLIGKPADARIILHRPPHKALHHTAKAKPQPNKAVVAAAAASAPAAPAEPKTAEPEKSDAVKAAEPEKTETARPPAEAKETRVPATAELPPPPPPQLAVTTPPPPAESAPPTAPSAPSAATAPAAPTIGGCAPACQSQYPEAGRS